MIIPLSCYMRSIVAGIEVDEIETSGDAVKKFRPNPKIKPPRRQPSTKNKSQRSDYMKEYMREYRGDGKDYQKVPDKVKKWRRKQKKKFKVQKKEGFNTKLEAEKMYQKWTGSPDFEKANKIMSRRFPHYNQKPNESKKAAEMLLKSFASWLKADPVYGRGGELSEYYGSVIEAARPKIHAGIT